MCDRICRNPTLRRLSFVLLLLTLPPAYAQVRWAHLSSKSGDLPVPFPGTQQTASLVLDIDKDGLNDFVITERTAQPSVVWYQRTASGWRKYLIEKEALPIEAGGAACDIDGDGDLNILDKPYNWDTPRIDVWVQQRGGIKPPTR